MTEQIQMEVINDASETESEEWDLIQNKDVQISGNTSDAESVEIINEEEALQTTSAEEPISSDNNDEICNNDSPEEFVHDEGYHNEENSRETDEIQSAEINSTSDAEYLQRDVFFGYFSQAERFAFALSGCKDAVYICLAVFVVGLAVLIIPEDDRFKTTVPAPVLNKHEIDVASLINELRMYRDSNENLKLQVKHLTEVVNGLQKFAQEPSADKIIGTSDQFQSEKVDYNPSDMKTILYNRDAFNGLIELINFYKEFSYLPNNTKINNENITSDATNDKFNYSTMFNEIFANMYNESIQNTLDLFYKIPVHLKELTTVVLQHKNVQPFVSKWGYKLNKFTQSLQNDIRKMKLKFAKHVLRSVNGIMNSFYKKLCNFEINKVITFQECDTLNFTKHWKKNKKIVRENGKKTDGRQSSDKFWRKEERKLYNNNNGKKYLKMNGNKENIARIDINEKIHPRMLSENDEEILANDNYEKFNTMPPEENFRPKIMERTQKNNEEINTIIKNLNNQEFQKKRVPPDDKMESIKKIYEKISINFVNSNENKNGKFNGIKYTENNDRKSRRIVTESCKKGYSLKCNETQKSVKVDDNWFLNMGNQRTKIRSHQSKVNWLFERARARRVKGFHDNHRQFYH